MFNFTAGLSVFSHYPRKNGPLETQALESNHPRQTLLSRLFKWPLCLCTCHNLGESLGTVHPTLFISFCSKILLENENLYLITSKSKGSVNFNEISYLNIFDNKSVSGDVCWLSSISSFWLADHCRKDISFNPPSFYPTPFTTEKESFFPQSTIVPLNQLCAYKECVFLSLLASMGWFLV